MLAAQTDSAAAAAVVAVVAVVAKQEYYYTRMRCRRYPHPKKVHNSKVDPGASPPCPYSFPLKLVCPIDHTCSYSEVQLNGSWNYIAVS